MQSAVADETRGAEPPPRAPSKPQESELGFFAQLALASHLDHDAYGVVARDPGNTWKIVVLLGLGGLAFGWERLGAPGPSQAAIYVGLAGVGWLLATGVAWVLSAGIPGAERSFSTVLRAVGFASYPFLLFAIVANTGRGTPMLVPILESGILAFAAFSLYTTMRHTLRAPPNLSAMLGLAALGAYMLPWVMLLSAMP